MTRRFAFERAARTTWVRRVDGALPIHGVGRSGHHRGEILQGAAMFPTGFDRFLIDLPEPDDFTTADVSLEPGNGMVTVTPATAIKVKRAAENLLARHCDEPLDMKVVLRSTATQGRGRGSSSSDLVACIRGFEIARGIRLTTDQISKVMIEAEGASNPLHIERPVVFQHRTGRVARWYGQWPDLTLVGFDDPTLPDVLTDKHPPARYTVAELDEFQGLLALASYGFDAGDVGAIGHVATRSTELNEPRLPKRLSVMREICASVGGAGIACSHSGSVGAFLFASADADVVRRVADTEAALKHYNFIDIANWQLP